MTSGRRHTERGFTLVEVVVASAVTLLLLGALLAVAMPMGQQARAQPEAIDVQQRLRAAADALMRDLSAAGAGLNTGTAAGPLGRYIPAVLPRRLGELGADAADAARSDVITILRVPVDGAEGALAAPMSSTALTLASGAACSVSSGTCRLVAGDGLVVIDQAGTFDLFNILGVSGADAQVEPRGVPSGFLHVAGAAVAEITARTYYFDGGRRQLRLYDTERTDVAVVDDITDFSIEYFGTPSTPESPKPLTGIANCLYDATGQLASVPQLPVGADGLAALPLAMFQDGPWCGTGATQFDADLLRIRRLRVSMAGQAASAVLRGRGGHFSVAGQSDSAWKWVPDLRVSFDVAPPNMEVP